MSTASLFLATLILATLSNVALGCSCMPSSLNTTMYSTANNQSLIFRGTVIRDITPPPPPVDPNSPFLKPPGRRQYVVQLGRIFRGCGHRAGDRVLVTTHSQSTMCGMPLVVSTNYVFESPLGSRPIDAATLANLGNRTQMRHTLSITLCGFNRVWDTVADSDKAILRSYPKQCAPSP